MSILPLYTHITHYTGVISQAHLYTRQSQDQSMADISGERNEINTSYTAG